MQDELPEGSDWEKDLQAELADVDVVHGDEAAGIADRVLPATTTTTTAITDT
jgi:hypothetical protein